MIDLYSTSPVRPRGVGSMGTYKMRGPGGFFCLILCSTVGIAGSCELCGKWPFLKTLQEWLHGQKITVDEYTMTISTGSSSVGFAQLFSVLLRHARMFWISLRQQRANRSPDRFCSNEYRKRPTRASQMVESIIYLQLKVSVHVFFSSRGQFLGYQCTFRLDP